MINNTTLTKKCKTKLEVKVNITSGILTIAIFVIMVMLLMDPTFYAKSVISGLKLFFTAVLPGLLPFMFLTKILSSLNLSKMTSLFSRPMKTLFNLPKISFYALFMSTISGYPIGSKITGDLYESNRLEKDDLLKTALLSSTSGPIFVIGSVGAIMFKKPIVGVIIYVSNLLAVLFSVILINLFEKKKKKKHKEKVNSSSFSAEQSTGQIPSIENKKQTFFEIISRAALDTASSLLVVGFYIAFFYCFIDMLYNIKVIEILSKVISPLFGSNPDKLGLSKGVMSGIVEMTRGAKALSSSLTPLSISLASFLIGFSGFSIIFQSLSFLSKTPIKASSFILGKLFQGVLSFIICLPLSLLI